MLGPQGLISNWLQNVGLLDHPLSMLDTRQAVQIGVVYNYLPLMIFPLFVALDRLDPALREGEQGPRSPTGWRRSVQVTLPLAVPGIVAGLMLVFIPLAGDYITASVLGGAKGNMVGDTRRQPVPGGPELGAGLGHGGRADRHDPADIASWPRWPSSSSAIVHRTRVIELQPPRPGRQLPARTVRHDRRRRAPPAAATPQRRRGSFDFVTFGLGVWSMIVYVFLFLPIVFVVAHSFTDGNAFLVWGGFSFDAATPACGTTNR